MASLVCRNVTRIHNHHGPGSAYMFLSSKAELDFEKGYGTNNNNKFWAFTWSEFQRYEVRPGARVLLVVEKNQSFAMNLLV
jgi:hypothetical protein